MTELKCCRECWENSLGSEVTLTGVIKAKRTHGKNLIFFDVEFYCVASHDEETSTWKSSKGREENIQIILNKKEYQNQNCLDKYSEESRETIWPLSFRQILILSTIGTVMSFNGRTQRSSTNELSIVAKQVWLIRISPNLPTILRLLRSNTKDEHMVTSKQLLHALLGWLTAPSHISDSEPLSEDAIPYKVTKDVYNLCLETCKKVLALSEDCQTNDMGCFQKSKRLCVSEHSKIDNSRSIEAIITRMCRILNGKSICRTRGHRLTNMEKELVGYINKASQSWPFIQELEVPLNPDGSVFCLTSPSSPEEITIDLLYRLNVHPENNLAALDFHGVTTDELVTSITQNVEHEQKFMNIEEKLYQKRYEYCRKKKAPQIIWILRKLWSFIHPSKRLSTPHSVIHICDIGGGKGDLAVSIAAVFGSKVMVHVIDIREEALMIGKELASRVNLENIRFHQADVEELSLDSSAECRCENLNNSGIRNLLTNPKWSPLCHRCDIIIGLHVCGGLTDALLSIALRSQIPFIIVPCCYFKNCKLRDQYLSLLHINETFEKLFGKDNRLQLEQLVESQNNKHGKECDYDQSASISPYKSILNAIFRLAESPDQEVASLCAELIAHVRILQHSRDTSVFSLFRFPSSHSQKNLIMCSNANVNKFFNE